MAIEDKLMLLTRPIDEIDYLELVEFCEAQIEEDLDLDYKAKIPNDFERTMCALANTQGGTILLGVHEKEKTRLPICPPTGMDRDPDSTRQRVLNIAFDAVYPPIEPEVKTVQVPETNRFVVLVRIHPSNLLHAVEHRSKIYVRSRDNNRDYSLASISDLQWLWDRRSASTSLRENLVKRARARSASQAVPFPDGISKEAWAKSPHLIVSLVPSFPQTPIVDSRELLDLANSTPSVRSPVPKVDRRVPWQDHHWRTIPNGISLTNRGLSYAGQYIEMGTHGEMFFDFLVPSKPVRDLPFGRKTNEVCIQSYIVFSSLDIALKYSAQFLEKLPTRQPYKLQVTVEGIHNFLLHFEAPSSRNTLGLEHLSLPSPENVIKLLHEEVIPPMSKEAIEELERRCAQAIAWAFGKGWDDDEISSWMAAHFPTRSA